MSLAELATILFPEKRTRAMAASKLALTFSGKLHLPEEALDTLAQETGIPRAELMVLTFRSPRLQKHGAGAITTDELLVAHKAIIALGRTSVSAAELVEIIRLSRGGKNDL